MEETKQAIINKKFPIIVSFCVCLLSSFLGGFFVVVATNVVYRNDATVKEQPPPTEESTLSSPNIVEYPVIIPEATERPIVPALVDRMSLEDIIGWGMAFITGVEIAIYGLVEFKLGFDRRQSNVVFFILAGLWVLMNGCVMLIIRAVGGIHAY